MEYTQSSLFGKTSQEHSQVMEGVTFSRCSKKSDRPTFQCLLLGDGQKLEWLEAKSAALRGEHWMLNFGESPSVVKESSLSQVLEESGGAVGEILFRSESMHGSFEKSESEEQRTSEIVRSCTDSAKRAISENVALQKEWTTGGSKGDRIRVNADKACTLSASIGGGASKTGLYLLKDSDRYIVRRLTPLECERLQGLPDNWTEGGSDSKRYKAIGNGMAQPCADFVIEKLVEVLKERG